VPAGREDRRVRRTRRLLHEALLALIVDKGYDRVTVQDVLDRADVGRATFYAHFRDKDDLLVSGFAALRDMLRGAMAGHAHGESLPATRALFEHVAAHRRLYHALVSSRAGAVVLRQVRSELVRLAREHFDDLLAQRRATPAVPVEVLAEHAVGALLGVVTWWLDHDMPYSVDQMAQLFERLMTPTLETGLGLADQPTGSPA
jgi:AcrR family transcriptional regulator